MIIRTLKLKLSKTTQIKLEGWMVHLSSVWNWGIRKIELDAYDKIYHSDFNFQNLLAGHSKRLGIPSICYWPDGQHGFSELGMK